MCVLLYTGEFHAAHSHASIAYQWLREASNRGCFRSQYLIGLLYFYEFDPSLDNSELTRGMVRIQCFRLFTRVSIGLRVCALKYCSPRCWNMLNFDLDSRQTSIFSLPLPAVCPLCQPDRASCSLWLVFNTYVWLCTTLVLLYWCCFLLPLFLSSSLTSFPLAIRT